MQKHPGAQADFTLSDKIKQSGLMEGDLFKIRCLILMHVDQSGLMILVTKCASPSMLADGRCPTWVHQAQNSCSICSSVSASRVFPVT